MLTKVWKTVEIVFIKQMRLFFAGQPIGTDESFAAVDEGAIADTAVLVVTVSHLMWQ